MKKYLLVLDKNYDIELGQANVEVENNLETMLDNMINLLINYGADYDEILEEIKEDTSINIKECE